VTLLTEFPAQAGFNEAEFARLDPAFIRFSSGTTGKAKGVVLSHATLLARIRAGNRRMEIGPADRVIWILPMAHHFAVSIMLYLLNGAVTVIVGSHLAEDLLTAGREHGGTVLYGAPFHHALLAAEPSGRPWPGLRLAVSTAAPLSLHTAQAFDDRFGIPLAQGLGIIEVGLPLLNTTAPREKPGSVGRPTPEVGIELRDPESGEHVLPGKVGELFLCTEGMLDAYLNPWQLKESVLASGAWFRTGDLAQLDHDGYLFLVGRTQSVINVAGMKCFPEEIEAVLQSHPGVHAARVFGRKHQRFGAIPVADIVATDPRSAPSSASLLAHCRRSLASYKIPVDFRFVIELPRTPSGKIQRTST
jgi:long-chain acyl-CoA synthetase